MIISKSGIYPWLLLIFLFVLPHSSWSQNIDSLMTIIKSSEQDTSKVKTYIELGKSFQGSDIDSAIYFFEAGLRLSKSEALRDFPKFKGLVLENIGFAYYNGNRDRDMLKKFLKRAMKAHDDEGLDDELSKTEFKLATSYGNFSMYDSAVYHYDQVVERNKRNETSIEMATSLSSSGLNSFYLRDLDKAAQSLLESIRYSQKTGDTARIFAPYMNYGLVLKEQGQYERAKEYMRKSQVLLNRINHLRGVALAYTNIGQILILQDSLDAAFESLTNAWEIDKTLGRSSVDYYNNIAWIERERGDYRKYHEYALEAANSIPEGYAPMSVADVYGSLVDAKILLVDSVYFDLTNQKRTLYREALPYAERGWHLADSVNSGNVKLELAETLSNLYAKLNRYEEAFEFSQKAKHLSEEINDQAKSEAIARMTTEFETERIANENQVLIETRQRQEAQLQQQYYLLLAGVVFILLVIVIAVIIYLGRQKLRKAHAIIEQSLAEKELLLKEIHHRVKNNLQVISSLLDLQSRNIEDEKTLSAFTEGQNRVKAMALIHQKLYQNENLATIDFAAYAEQLLAELANIYPVSSEVKSTLAAGDKIYFDIDTAIPLGLILNELVSNAYKYAFKEGKTGSLKVSILSLTEGQHQLIVEDTGAGLPDHFDFQKAKSMGLRLVRRLAKQLYGKVDYSTEQGAKFVVNFTDTAWRKAI